MKISEQYPTNSQIIYLLGMGVLLAGSLAFPGLGHIAKVVVKAKRKHDWEKSQREWKKFNLRHLKRNLKRLHDQKIVETVEQDGQQLIKLTQKGQAKYFKFKFEELSLKAEDWDKKWRLVIYDIQTLRKRDQENFRAILKKMKFLQLQKSVYLTPYSCQETIEYLREYFNLSQEIMFLEVTRLENEEYYKEYFDLK